MSRPIDIFEELKKRPDLIPEASEQVKRTYNPEDFIEFHAARILHLVGYAGKGRPSQIDGRRRFSFYDFLLRFPVCFAKAAEIFKVATAFEDYELKNIDSKMIQHVGGPWDQRYYDILAYLAARKLVQLSGESGWNIALAPAGAATLKSLDSPENAKLRKRCRILKDMFGTYTEKRLHGFIDKHFPYTQLG
jgi:hypothetical protein